MSKWLLLAFLGLCTHLCQAQVEVNRTFRWNDTAFYTWQVRTIRLPHSQAPRKGVYTYDYSQNRPVYDTLIHFLQKNPQVSVHFIVHSKILGNKRHNFLSSFHTATVFTQVLDISAVHEQCYGAMAIGEERPLISRRELSIIRNRKKRREADAQNERIEVVIDYQFKSMP